jgi:hypothetical protein
MIALLSKLCGQNKGELGPSCTGLSELRPPLDAPKDLQVQPWPKLAQPVH